MNVHKSRIEKSFFEPKVRPTCLVKVIDLGSRFGIVSQDFPSADFRYFRLSIVINGTVNVIDDTWFFSSAFGMLVSNAYLLL